MTLTIKKTNQLLDPALLKPAIIAAFTKLSPAVQWRNPVMFVVYIGSILTTLLGFQVLQGGSKPSGATGGSAGSAGFTLAVALWLWFTVLFANFAEAMAEGRAQAQAASLRGLKKSTWAKKFKEPVGNIFHGATWLPEQAENLRKGDVVFIETGEMVPLLCVRDHGPGLPPAVKGRESALFDKFTRGKAESATPGVGLGLAIWKAVVDKHGGQIVARNASGGGALFCVTLPRHTPPEAA